MFYFVYNMFKVMDALVEVDFDGIVIADHIPELGSVPGRPSMRSNGLRPGLAYSIGYLKAMLKAALTNRGKA